MNKQKRALAIHDISCVGRCSLTVALPILSVGRIDTSVLPTAILSTHTGGFTDFTYRDLTADIRPISQHWQSLGLKFDALYSGFLGSFAQIDLVAELFDTFKRKDNLILVDPVMADHGELYSVYTPEMASGMGKLCAKADIIVPNLTEAAFLLGEPYIGEQQSQQYVESTLKKLGDIGVPQVVLTGICFEYEKLGAASYDSNTGRISYAFLNRIPGYFHGTGDVFGSTMLAALLNGFTLEQATQLAVEFTHRCIELTVEAKQELRYGVCFERALPLLIEKLNIGA